ncbi:MAG: nuclear transport factor 2 family protein [Chitinophagaceae bacterium]
MTDREKIIKNYIDSYNRFDIDEMVIDFDDNIIFENIQNGVTNMSLIGLAAFRQQAEQAITYFTARTQTIKSFKHFDNRTEIEIDYNAVLGMDFPNGMKKGQELDLSGKSIFRIQGREN